MENGLASEEPLRDCSQSRFSSEASLCPPPLPMEGLRVHTWPCDLTNVGGLIGYCDFWLKEGVTGVWPSHLPPIRATHSL